MEQMADKTGGKAFINTNGLKEAVDQRHRDRLELLHHQLLPSAPEMGRNFHSVAIKLTEPKLKLSYRIGYYADDPDGPPSQAARPIFSAAQAKAAAEGPDPVETARAKAMRAAMQFGAPEPTQIVMKVKVAPKGPGHEDALADGNCSPIPSQPMAPTSAMRWTMQQTRATSSSSRTPTAPSRPLSSSPCWSMTTRACSINSFSRTAVANVDAASPGEHPQDRNAHAPGDQRSAEGPLLAARRCSRPRRRSHGRRRTEPRQRQPGCSGAPCFTCGHRKIRGDGGSAKKRTHCK